MNKNKVLNRQDYIKHLKKFSQYSRNASWMSWYSRVARLKGLRTAQILEEYKDNNSKVLDLGCGIGLTLSILTQRFPKSIGCDVDPEAVKATKGILEKIQRKVPVVLYDGNNLPFANNSFDIVVSIEVIEHVNNPYKMLSEIRRVLKPDGILHITTANKWWPYEPHFRLLFLSYLPEFIADFYIRLTGKGESYHDIKLPSYWNFKKMVNKYFFVEDITLSLIENYKKYSFDKERGKKVVLVGNLLIFLNKFNNPLVKNITSVIKWFLIRISLGWLFIARPR